MKEGIKLNSKIIDLNEFSKLREELRNNNKTIIHCHGVFDLIHPGHITHFQEAKNMGDILIVTITAAPYIQKGPGRPYFNDEQRLTSLAALEMVNYVALVPDVTAIPAIKAIQPDIYVKGKEYSVSEDDVTNNIDKEINEVRKQGGEVHFTGGQVFSSTKLLNTAFSALPKEVVKTSLAIKKDYDIKYIKSCLEEFSDKKVLVVGDIIIDEYVDVEVQGLMSKDNAFSSKYVGSNKYLGGSLAVANHLSGFSNKVTLCSMLGTEAKIHSDILNSLGNRMFLDLDFNENFHTIIKRKYVYRSGEREEYRKVFAISYLQDDSKGQEIDKGTFYKKLESGLDNCDLVVVCDYGHGLIDDYAMELINSKGKYMSLNCQTNSSNYGLNLITKYKKANVFALDEKELKLAMKDEKTDKGQLLAELKEILKAEDAFLTMGSSGAKAINKDGKIITYPALVLNVKDTIGAGDAFFSMVSVCSFLNMPIELSNLLGNAAGAIIANVVSNSEAINKSNVLKFVSTILNV